ncbi:MAG: tRNA (5-methylaminomethyl-2-thiouridine)(34)-methyltransferase MnmD [Flavobacteriales bacterium]|nr:tRNA (5-methylaminomethyl-2-thiouridine)(34)-methyltransferase MnmD [Flavobacteriales bacterium]
MDRNVTSPGSPVLHRTADGSLTLFDGGRDAHYHSVFGAIQESTHVFIRSGLQAIQRDHVDVLEVGLGTGLNLLLTWIRCMEGKCTVHYTALEPHPLSRETLIELDHCNELGWAGLQEPFLDRMLAPEDAVLEPFGGLELRQLRTPVQEFAEVDAHDVIYFDPFAPNTAPEQWTVDVFSRMFNALRMGGLLVTYCAKGQVRRDLQAAGFNVERLQGPPGKREMLRATKPFPSWL